MDESNLLTADTSLQVTIEQELIEQIHNYDFKVQDMRSVYKEMASSSSWKDSKLKEAFLEELDKYIIKFEELKEKMNSQIKNLGNNTTKIDQIENIFS